MAESNESLIQVSHLDLIFGSKPELAFEALEKKKGRDQIKEETGQILALHDVTFSVKKNEIFVLMGLSGSGKSTLLRCLNGMNGRREVLRDERGQGSARGQVLFRENASELDILSCSVEELREVRRRHITMVFQEFGLMPWRTVWENVALPLQLRRIPKSEIRKSVNEKLELVGLTDWRDRYPQELSGGMQQRVGLARAFVTQAEVLLMDEPFSALDPFHRKRLQKEILVLQKELNKTVVFVTHDREEAFETADRIAIVESGKILQIDTPDNIQRNPLNHEVERIVSRL